MKFNGKIAVLKGGFSDERAISLKTSENVEQALKELGFKYTSIDCKDDFIEKLISSNFQTFINKPVLGNYNKFLGQNTANLKAFLGMVSLKNWIF